MNYSAKIAVFIAALLLGSLAIYTISPLLTYFAVSLTGQGWLFGTLRWILLALFWGLILWKFKPRKDA